MKSLLSFLFLFFAITSFSQQITATASRQSWAGGTCCRTGTNYTIAIFANLDSLNKTEIKSVMIDGHEFYINKLADTKNEMKVLHFNFQVSYDMWREDILDEKIEIIDRTIIPENYVLVLYNNLEMKIPFKIIDDLYPIAYP